RGPSGALMVNRLLKGGSEVALIRRQVNGLGSPVVSVNGARDRLDRAAGDFKLEFSETREKASRIEKGAKERSPLPGVDPSTVSPLHSPRIGLYQSWTSNMDEGWT